LAQKLKQPAYDGEPEWMPDSGNTGPITLPMAFKPSL